MSKADQIVSALLEADEPAGVNIPPEDVDINPESYLHQYADQLDRDKREGKVTPQTALTAQYFWHKTVKYADGRSAYGVRRNGRTQTWKTRPGEFRIPIKIGFRGYGEITDKNADEWTTVEPTPLPKPPKPPRAKKVINPSSLMPPPTV